MTLTSDKAPSAERLEKIVAAIRGCEIHSSDADFETLGAMVYRNRELIIDALAESLARAEVEARTAWADLVGDDHDPKQTIEIDGE